MTSVSCLVFPGFLFSVKQGSFKMARESQWYLTENLNLVTKMVTVNIYKMTYSVVARDRCILLYFTDVVQTGVLNLFNVIYFISWP